MRLRELKSSDIRQVNGFVRRASRLTSLDELEALFISDIGRILPNDCPVWNNQSMDFMTILSASILKDYEEEAFGRIDALYAHFFDHPVLTAYGGYEQLQRRPVQMSECTSDKGIRENPLWREFYRHIDSTYQVAMHVATLSDRQVVITLNNGRRDFDRNFVHKFHYLCLGIRGLAKALDRRRLLQGRLDLLTGLLGNKGHTSGLETLTPAEIGMLDGLLRQPTLTASALQASLSVRTLDERTATMREKLGLENTAQLRAALHAMRAPASR